MKIIILAATEIELQLIKKNIQNKNNSILFKVHGVGILSSTFFISNICQLKPDLMIQCGIAGANHTNLNLGETVIVENDIIEIGAESKEDILDMFDLKLEEANHFPFSNTLLPCPFLENKFLQYKHVNALTVAVNAGTKTTIEKRIKKFKADIETMEGAALHYVCLQNNIPFLQIRTISNYVEIRNKDNWNIPLALQKNADAVLDILSLILKDNNEI